MSEIKASLFSPIKLGNKHKYAFLKKGVCGEKDGIPA
jgi:hypothetical protein